MKNTLDYGWTCGMLVNPFVSCEGGQLPIYKLWKTLIFGIKEAYEDLLGLN